MAYMYETDMYVKLYETQKYGKYKHYLHTFALSNYVTISQKMSSQIFKSVD